MTFYLITISILGAFSFLEIYYRLNDNLKQAMSMIAYAILIYQVGLRWETGTDWNSYLEHFKTVDQFDFGYVYTSGMEFGYNLFVWSVKLVSANYSIFLLIHAVFFYLLLFSSLKKYSPYFFLSLLLFYTFTLGMEGSNRQLIALVICLYSIRFIIEKDAIRFLLLIFFAFNFHTTALLFIFFYFLNRNSVSIYMLLLIIFGSIIIGKSSLPTTLFSLFGGSLGEGVSNKTITYVEMANDVLAENKLSLVGLFKRLFFVFIFYYNRKKIAEQLPYYNLMLNAYIVGICVYFLFSSSLLVIVSRGSLYFNMFEPLLLCCQMLLFKEKYIKVVAVILLILFSFFYFIQSISAYKDLFLPYKGLFINEQYYRTMY